MKRLVALLLAAAVCAPATLLAQDSEASEEYALEQARLKYQSATQSTTIATEQGTTVGVTVIEAPPSVQQEGQADASDERRPYTPFLLRSEGHTSELQ